MQEMTFSDLCGAIERAVTKYAKANPGHEVLGELRVTREVGSGKIVEWLVPIFRSSGSATVTGGADSRDVHSSVLPEIVT